MAKTKLVLWALIFGFIGLVIIQNQDFFLERNSFDLNFLIVKYQVPELYNVILFVACFLLGLLISYFLSLAERFKANKIIKRLKTTVDTHVQKINALESELASLQTQSNQPKEETEPAREPRPSGTDAP